METKACVSRCDQNTGANTTDPQAQTPVARREAIGKLASIVTAIVGFGPPIASRASAQVAVGGSTLALGSWVHGLSVQPEDPSRIASLVRRGFQAQLRTYGQTWIHFAIPTPAIQSGARLRLHRVMVLWDTDRVSYTSPPQPIGARMLAVHVWDADNKVAEFGEVQTIGQFLPSGVYERANPFYIPNTPYVYYGTGVSILIDAPVSINLKSVGGDYYLFNQGCVSC
jgi:hypothetical protein